MNFSVLASAIGAGLSAGLMAAPLGPHAAIGIGGAAALSSGYLANEKQEEQDRLAQLLNQPQPMSGLNMMSGFSPGFQIGGVGDQLARTFGAFGNQGGAGSANSFTGGGNFNYL